MSQSTRPVGPAWWQYLWTFVFSCGVAAVFTVIGFSAFANGEGAWRNWLGWGEWYLSYLVVSLCIGYAIHGLFGLGRRLVGERRIAAFSTWQRALYFSALPSSGVAIGMTLGAALLGGDVRDWFRPRDANSVASFALISLLIWLVFTQYFASRARRIIAEHQATQAQLRLLQAQMEPHFLFNTLANVVGLMEADTPRAKRMLESFTDYLRASLGSLREGEQTLGAELDLVDAYLRVVAVRMEARLRYRIEVPEALRTLRVPALSLQPLVENAVVHGLEPQIEGGELVVAAHADGTALVITVTDDGLGLQAAGRASPRGTGTALNNIRERLLQLHGERGLLQLEPAAPRGVRATLTLPLPN
jgi:Histidine kinase